MVGAGQGRHLLRFGVEGRPDRERPLDEDALSALLQEAAAYRLHGEGLLALGEGLYQWLDGPAYRWLADHTGALDGVTIRIDCEEGLRRLPWELMADGGAYLSVDPLRLWTPVYNVSDRDGTSHDAANRPLRVLFMASSPEDVRPELAFEDEEARILDAAGGNVDLLVEESGSLKGLSEVILSHDPGYFDVLHLSGHAEVRKNTPRFLMENDVGFRDPRTARDIAVAIEGRWPRVVFVSGCSTAEAGGDGSVPSMIESLVSAGSPAALGWALPVGDYSASWLAAALYGSLAIGQPLDEATARSRQRLFEQHSPYWHLLRLCADPSPFTPFVTALNTHGRPHLLVRHASEAFVDEFGVSRVSSRANFVGRRRQLQRILRTLREQGTDRTETMLVHGTGGYGKSTLCSRIVDRMQQSHRHAIWTGEISEPAIRRLTSLVTFDEADTSIAVNELLDKTELSLTERLTHILSGPLASTPLLFVFDEFEVRNIESRGGGFVARAAALEVINALATAIRSTGSRSRLIIASRYKFETPPDLRMAEEPVDSLKGADLDKKLRSTVNLGPASELDADTRESIAEASGGIPRLLEWFDLLISDPATDHLDLVSAIEDKANQFKEDILAAQLLRDQTPDFRRVLAYATIFEIPVPAEAIEAACGDLDAAGHIQRATAIGLLEAGINPADRGHRYFMSSVIRPVLEEELGPEEVLSEPDLTEAHTRAAPALFELWVEPETAADA